MSNIILFSGSTSIHTVIETIPTKKYCDIDAFRLSSVEIIFSVSHPIKWCMQCENFAEKDAIWEAVTQKVTYYG